MGTFSANRSFPRYGWSIECENQPYLYGTKASFSVYFLWLCFDSIYSLIGEGNNRIIIELFVSIFRDHVLSKVSLTSRGYYVFLSTWTVVITYLTRFVVITYLVHVFPTGSDLLNPGGQSEIVTLMRLYIHLVRMFETVVAISARVNTVWNCHRAEIALQYV